MGIRINEVMPNLEVETDQGTFMLHDWIGDTVSLTQLLSLSPKT